MRSLSLRPDDSLTIPKMALSIGFIRFVSSTNTIPATRVLTVALVGLFPTECASLRLDARMKHILAASSGPEVLYFHSTEVRGRKTVKA